MARSIVIFLSWALQVACFHSGDRATMTSREKHELRDKVQEMFTHAYGAYKEHAFPADELMPLSCKGRYRGTEVDRGDIDEALGNFSLTLIDTLDTLVVLGRLDEFDAQVKYVIANVSFNADAVVSVFETNIRVLGGLLGAHCAAVALKESGKKMAWYKDELLEKALDIGDRLLVAFNTSTGIPFPKINLRYGVNHPYSRVGHETETCTACAGTMIMEFAALSRLTGRKKYEDKAHKAMEALWSYRSQHYDLVGTTINIHNGNWVRRDSGVGAGIDSYYEYCLKAYILLGDESYLDKFNKHYAAIKRYIKQGYMFLDVLMHQPERPVRTVMDALQAFWPGLQVLKGDLQPAIETHEMLYHVAKKYKFLPEAFTSNMDVYWANHPLRPEFAESTYFLFQATKDPYYLTVGRHIIESLEDYARVPCGFAAVKDVRTLTKEDKMDSFFLAETFKYLYLLFSEESEHVIDIHDFIFTTEAHLLPLYLSTFPSAKDINASEENPPIDHASDELPSSCPNRGGSVSDLRAFASTVRSRVRPPASPVCHSSSPQDASARPTPLVQPQGAEMPTHKERSAKLLAKDFKLGNEAHQRLLKEMGITLVQGTDGKVQLIHQVALAATVLDAQDGIAFMQDILQLAKQNGDNIAEIKSVVVQLMTGNSMGSIALAAGPAQFGFDLAANDVGISAGAVLALPSNACDAKFENRDELKDKIVVVERGGCMFIEKVRNAQQVGALGVIVVDNVPGTSVEAQATFAMSGDNNTDDVRIPAAFLFHKEGQLLAKHMKETKEMYDEYMEVRLASRAKPVELSGRKASREGRSAESTSSAEATRPNDANRAPAESSLLDFDFSKMSAKQDIVIDESGRKVTTTTSEEIVANNEGKMVKHIVRTIETCPTMECGSGVTYHVLSYQVDVATGIIIEPARDVSVASVGTGVEDVARDGSPERQEKPTESCDTARQESEVPAPEIVDSESDGKLAGVGRSSEEVLESIDRLVSQTLRSRLMSPSSPTQSKDSSSGQPLGNDPSYDDSSDNEPSNFDPKISSQPSRSESLPTVDPSVKLTDDAVQPDGGSEPVSCADEALPPTKVNAVAEEEPSIRALPAATDLKDADPGRTEPDNILLSRAEREGSVPGNSSSLNERDEF